MSSENTPADSLVPSDGTSLSMDDATRIIMGIDLDVTEADNAKQSIEAAIKFLEGWKPESKAAQAAISVLVALGKAVLNKF